MPKPTVLQIGAYPAWDEEALTASFNMLRYFEVDDKPGFLARNAATIRAVATRGELGASSALIQALPALEIISIYGVGFDAVDLAAARSRGIHVTNTPDVLTKDVADLAVAMMLGSARGVPAAEAWVRSGNWARKGLFPLQRRAFGKRAGILGLGRIGREVAKRLVGFEMDIAYCNSDPKDYASDWTFIGDPVELAARSDFLFVTMTGGEATRHSVNREVIEALGPEGTLINVSRASNIDEDALLEALETGKLGWAALDVFEGEPHLNPRFMALENVLLQPHQASGTVETRKAMGKLVHDNLFAHFSGAPLLTPVV